MQRGRFVTTLQAAVVLFVVVLVAACGPGASLAPTAGPTNPPATGTGPPASVAATQTACVGDTTPDPAVTGTLSVYDWSGYDAKDFWADFGNKYKNAKVNFDATAASDGDIYTNISTALKSPDIIHPYTGWLQFYANEGLVREIDTSKLKNWCKVPEKFRAIGQFNGKQYFVPWDWGFSSILYRKDKITSVDSWSILLDPQYDGHLMMWNDGPGAVTVSSYIHGWDETKITADQLAQVKTEWTRMLSKNKAMWLAEPELVDGFENNDVWAGYAWQGTYATLLTNGKVQVAYADPKEHRNSWIGAYGITKDAKDYDLALKFLDEKLGDLTGNNLVSLYYYGTANADVMKSITDPTLKTAFSVGDPTVLDRTNYTPLITTEQRNAWTTMWNEVKTAAGLGQ